MTIVYFNARNRLTFFKFTYIYSRYVEILIRTPTIIHNFSHSSPIFTADNDIYIKADSAARW